MVFYFAKSFRKDSKWRSPQLDEAVAAESCGGRHTM